MKKKATIAKDTHHSELVEKLARLAYTNAIFYPPHVAEYIKDGNKTILKLLKKAKITPEECTGSVLRLAHEKYDRDWKQSIRDWNTTPGNIPVVLVGDPEFDSSVRALETPEEPAQPAISELETPEVEETGVEAPETPQTPVLAEEPTPNPWELSVDDLEKALPVAKKPVDTVDKKEKTNRGATYLGYSLSGVLRWIADHDRKKKVDREASLDRLRRFVIKLEMSLSHHTVKCQHVAGWLGKNHYGEMPAISKKDQKTILALLDGI